MADQLHRVPRRKRRARLHCLESPFPVPIETITGKLSDDSRWYYYFGDLQTDHVSVKRLGDLTFLYRLGFFGKGVLSKGRPQYNKYGDALSTDTRKQYIFSLRKLEPEKREQKLAEFDRIQSERLRHHHEWATQGNLPLNQPEEITSTTTNITNTSESNHHELDTQLDQCVDLHTYIDDGHVEEYSTDGEDEEEVNAANDIDSQSCGQDSCEQSSNTKENKEANVDLSCKISTDVDSNIGDKQSSGTKESMEVTVDVNCRNSTENDHEVSNLSKTKHLSNTSNQNSSLEVGSNTEISTETNPNESQMHQQISQKLNLKRSHETDDNVNEDKKMKLTDDYPMAEFLCLSFEEAFFLSFGLGCLNVKSNDKTLQIIDMWQTFCERHKSFPEMYTVYHYLRSKGWVVRSGSLFGADFVLYQDGMPFFHASHCVYVHMIDEESLSSPTFTATWEWKYLSCINRVHERIAKDTLFCFVVKPKNFVDDEFSSPRCLRRLRVMEFMMRRWVPKKTRDVVK